MTEVQLKLVFELKKGNLYLPITDMLVMDPLSSTSRYSIQNTYMYELKTNNKMLIDCVILRWWIQQLYYLAFASNISRMRAKMSIKRSTSFRWFSCRLFSQDIVATFMGSWYWGLTGLNFRNQRNISLHYHLGACSIYHHELMWCVQILFS